MVSSIPQKSKLFRYETSKMFYVGNVYLVGLKDVVGNFGPRKVGPSPETKSIGPSELKAKVVKLKNYKNNSRVWPQ